LRLGLFGSGFLLVLVLAMGTYGGLTPEWQKLQEKARALSYGEQGLGLAIVQQSICTGEQERCQTCHLGIEREERHSPSMARHLAKIGIGCTMCHGGCGRALTVLAAHAQSGTETQEPRLGQPYIQAGCVQCHIPGEKPGMERLVRGANHFLELGCLLCHPLTPDSAGGWDYGTDLLLLGQRSLSSLQNALIDPAANFVGSTMPSFEKTFDADREALQDLLVFLESLQFSALNPLCRNSVLGQSRFFVPCQDCHVQGASLPNPVFSHRCLYLKERREEMECARCHLRSGEKTSRSTRPQEAVLQAGGCPVLSQHWGGCKVCHRQGRN
jgi:hypothetical protein